MVSSVKILRIVEKEQYSPAHNERIKVQKLNDINLKIKALLGVNEDVIISIKTGQENLRCIKFQKIIFIDYNAIFFLNRELFTENH